MKRFYLPICFLLVLLCCSCHDDDSDQGNHSKHNVVMKETLLDSKTIVYRTDMFQYSNDRLSKHTTEQSYNDVNDIHTWSLSHAANSVVVTESSGTKHIYTLSPSGLATNCITTEAGISYQTNFSYDADNHLTGVTNMDSEGNTICTLDLTWVDDELASITLDKTTKSIFTTDKKMETANLPYFLYADVYPLSEHREALMDGLLGKYPLHMVSTMTVGSNESRQYTYLTDDKGAVTHITETLTYTGEEISEEGVSSIKTTVTERVITFE